MMQVLITAAGLGRRMGDINCPKSSLMIGTECIIEHSIVQLLEIQKELNIPLEIIVVTGYKADILETFLKKYPIKIVFNPYYNIANSIASLWQCYYLLNKNEDLMIFNADLYWDKKIVIDLIKSDKEMIVAGDSSRVKKGVGDFFLYAPESIIKQWGKELDSNHRSFESFGIAKIKKERMERYLAAIDNSMRKEWHSTWWAITLYSYFDDVFVLDVSEYFWTEVDTIEDYKNLQHYLKTKNFSLKYHKNGE